MISFSKKKHLSRIRIFIIVLASAGLFCLALPVIAQESLAPLNPDFLEYFQRPQISEVQRITAEEYPLGFIPPPLDLSHLMGQPIFQAHELAAAPSSYDLRALGRLTPVKDQRPCGSCWTFATYGSLESNLLPSETWDFSENNLKNTHGFDFDHCEGGNGLMSTAYLARWSGPVSEADDPYNPSSNISPSGLTVRKHIQEVLIIPDRANSSDNDNIKQGVMTYGALMTSMYVSDSDSYNSTYNAYYYNGTANQDHAVAIVGWDDNFDKNKFSTVPPGNGAFIIKNSWGTGWGENGYFYVSYYDTKIGKYNYIFNSAEPTTDYSRVYQYDPLGLVNHLGYGSTTAWFANIFIASATELLSAVSFYTPSPNSSYEIYVYTNVTSGPTSGSLAGTGTGTIAIPGYHTIPLAISVSVASGQKFSVAVRLTTPGYNYPIPIEMPIPDSSSQATAQAGESYISNDGMSWADITVSYPNTNVCVKAFTIQGPNLTPYQPSGWSDKIVVSKTTGTNTDSTPIYTTDTLYVDWAVINNGTGATSATFYTKLYVDGVERQSWYKNPPLNVNYYIPVTDYSIGTLSAGTHTIKIVADSTNAVDESNESDNEYTKTITVQASAISYTITANPSGLQIVVDGSTYTAPYNFNWTPASTHNISVSSPQNGTSGTRYVYSSWSDGGAQSHTITVPSSSMTYTANFTTQFNLTTSVNPLAGGGVTPSGTNWYSSAQTVSVSASANAGYTFSNWSGDLSGSTNPAPLVMTSPKNVTANFTQNQYTLTININPSGAGSVSKSPNKSSYVYGDQVMLTATANSGYTFSGWSGDLSGTANPASITMNGDKSVTANFSQSCVYTLTVNINPPGSGTVTKNPDKSTYCPGDQVTLTAVSNSGYTFGAWIEGTSPIGTSNPITIAMNTNRTITANFTRPGDCKGDGQTTIDEVQRSINQFLGVSQVQPCCDLNGNGQVTIDEVQRVINAFLGI